MPATCRNGHMIRGPIDYTPGEGCKQCRRSRQRVYMADCRAARRKLRQLEALLEQALELAVTEGGGPPVSYRVDLDTAIPGSPGIWNGITFASWADEQNR